MTVEPEVVTVVETTRIPRLLWLVIVLAALGGTVGATLTFTEGRESDRARKDDVQRNLTVILEVQAMQDCIVALVLMPEAQRATLTDDEIRALCPDRTVDLRPVVVTPAAATTAPPATTATTTLTSSTRTRSTVPRFRTTTTTTTRPATTTTTRPTATTTTTTTAPCPISDVSPCPIPGAT